MDRNGYDTSRKIVTKEPGISVPQKGIFPGDHQRFLDSSGNY